MLPREVVAKQLNHTLQSISLPAYGKKYEGKVRDCFTSAGKRVIVATDRLSAFDVVLTTIPFKGRLLTEMAAYWFSQTQHIIANHIIKQPHPNVMIAQEVEILPIEVVVRGYLAGSAWRDYQAGKAISGITLPKGMKKSQRLERPIITPSTKAERGIHDEPISSDEIVRQRIVAESLWDEVCSAAMKLFEFGTQKAKERGLILVDTKYEFGVAKDENGKSKLLLADEIHTQDSSRFWMLDSYEDRFNANEDPVMLDKEFVRRWLIERGYMGEGTPPQFPDDFRVDTAMRYIDAYEKITGQEFCAEAGPVEESIAAALEKEI
ncbi:MAG TPA: phosphoribosylaminoimidazolesuccinocarboxamide synthase [Oligoflexia bacterium]|nr:phosphoribosylaminoimidazolesuccinocarboxamide synthase [Oligoflexia bacterium]